MKTFSEIISQLKLLARGFSRYRSAILALTFLGFLGGLLEGIGINALIPFFSLITGGANDNQNFISRSIKEVFSSVGVNVSVKSLLIFVVLLFVLKALVLMLFSYLSVKITADYEKKVRSELFTNTLKAGWPYLLTQKLGHLETVLVTNVQQSRGLLTQISNTVMMVTNLLVYTVIAVTISFSITALTFTLGLLLFWISKNFIYGLRRLAREEESLNRQISHHINENILGLKAIKASSVHEAVARVARGYFELIRKIRIRTNLLNLFTSYATEPVAAIFIGVIFALTFKTPAFSLAALGAVLYLAKQIFSYIQQLQKQVLAFNSAMPYLETILAYEEEVQRYREEEDRGQAFHFSHQIEFKNISFSYNHQDQLLRQVSFQITRGQVVGLIGPSGAGKTTIVDLLLRLFSPRSGEILIDGQNVDQVALKAWRANIGYVSQDIFLMNDTIANNIRFYDSRISDEEIIEAAKMANIYDFIKDCPHGLETMVGERGLLLSGGQRQRLVIARALVKKPKLLILDEATSALDNESELKIQDIIRGLKGKITVLIIAHRLSTIVSSDYLLVLEKGQLIETGTPTALLNDTRSYFHRVYHLKHV